MPCVALAMAHPHNIVPHNAVSPIIQLSSPRTSAHSNAMGGILGGMESIGAAVEHQRLGTPHLHFNGHVVSIYQHCTLEEIARRIEEELLQPEEVYAYHSWVCREEHMVPELHKRKLPQAELDVPEHGGFRLVAGARRSGVVYQTALDTDFIRSADSGVIMS